MLRANLVCGMFSLIITIISIALVVALVAATMYYGGSALNQGSVKADAAGFVAGAQQISTAISMAELDGVGNARSFVDMGFMAQSFMASLISSNYLATVPQVKAGPNNSKEALPQNAAWNLNSGYNPVDVFSPDGVLIAVAVSTVLQASVENPEVCAKLRATGNPDGGTQTGQFTCDDETQVFSYVISRSTMGTN